jgi:hypothetical protein
MSTASQSAIPAGESAKHTNPVVVGRRDANLRRAFLGHTKTLRAALITAAKMIATSFAVPRKPAHQGSKHESHPKWETQNSAIVIELLILSDQLMGFTKWGTENCSFEEITT